MGGPTGAERRPHPLDPEIVLVEGGPQLRACGQRPGAGKLAVSLLLLVLRLEERALPRIDFDKLHALLNHIVVLVVVEF